MNKRNHMRFPNPRKARTPRASVWREQGYIVGHGGAVTVERKGNNVRVRPVSVDA